MHEQSPHNLSDLEHAPVDESIAESVNPYIEASADTELDSVIGNAVEDTTQAEAVNEDPAAVDAGYTALAGVSTALAIRDHHRQAFNTIRGFNTVSHRDNLTAEQAKQINEQYDIVAYVGTHGLVAPPGAKVTAESLIHLPTQLEYQEAADFIDTLQPGDILLSEGFGYTQPEAPENDAVRMRSEFEDKILSGNDISGASLGFIASEMGIRMLRDHLEQRRQDYQLTAWDYATELALLKGIKVVRADYDAYDTQSIKEVTGAQDLLEDVVAKQDEAAQSMSGRMQEQREHKAVNILKNYALEHPDPALVLDKGEPRKPRLALLFGGAHKDGLRRDFDNLRLDAQVVEMANSSARERITEQALYNMKKAFEANPTPPREARPLRPVAADARTMERGRQELQKRSAQLGRNRTTLGTFGTGRTNGFNRKK